MKKKSFYWVSQREQGSWHSSNTKFLLASLSLHQSNCNDVAGAVSPSKKEQEKLGNFLSYNLCFGLTCWCTYSYKFIWLMLLLEFQMCQNTEARVHFANCVLFCRTRQKCVSTFFCGKGAFGRKNDPFGHTANWPEVDNGWSTSWLILYWCWFDIFLLA